MLTAMGRSGRAWIALTPAAFVGRGACRGATGRVTVRAVELARDDVACGRVDTDVCQA